MSNEAAVAWTLGLGLVIAGMLFLPDLMTILVGLGIAAWIGSGLLVEVLKWRARRR